MHVLFDHSAIEVRVAELARQIAADCDPTPPLFVGILNGAVPFMMDLMAALPLEMRRQLQYDFVDLSSYEGDTSSGHIAMSKDLVLDIRDRDLLVVDGIVDTGGTLRHLLALFEQRAPRSVKVCTLLDKAVRRQYEVQIDYCGFAIEDLFIVGYGMDYKQQYRALPYVGVL